MTRPLKVGEYRKVKTIQSLRSMEKFRDIDFGFTQDMYKYCDTILRVQQARGIMFDCPAYHWFKPEFFTDDYYDENGNEVKMGEDIEVGDLIELTSIESYDEEDGLSIGDKFTVLDMFTRTVLIHNLKTDSKLWLLKSKVKVYCKKPVVKQLDQWHNDIDPLDQLEATTKQDIANSNKVLDEIALMREIDLKQVEIDQLIQAQDKRIEEYEKGETDGDNN